MTPEAGQAGHIGLTEEVRDRILSDPAMLLEDAEIMQALVAANDRARGENIVDLRGIAMRRLEGRLDRLEETHRSVIAAAYENLAGMNLVHRAVLELLEPLTFDAFLARLAGPVKQVLRVDSLHLILETRQGEDGALSALPPPVLVVEAGSIDRFLGARDDQPAERVVLRLTAPGDAALHGEDAARIRSEAGLRLDLGPGRLPGLLLLGAQEARQFRPQQGTDLLRFLGHCFELCMRRWLS